jgi:hypothetical protein
MDEMHDANTFATAGQLVTSERGVCGGPLAFHYANLMSHSAFRQSLACVSLLYQIPLQHGSLRLSYSIVCENTSFYSLMSVLM